MRKNPGWFFVTVLIVIVATFFLSLNLGVIRITPIEVMQVFLGQGTDQQALVLYEFRLPRMVLALLIGAGIAVSGAVLQGLSNNELADPGILGINAGAGLAIVLFIYFIGDSTATLSTLSTFIMPIFAFLGALVAAILIYVLAWKKGINAIRLILVGIGVNAGFGAGLIIFQLKMDPQDFMQATIWLSGSIWGTNWMQVLAILPWILLLIPFVTYRARFLNALQLGDSMSKGLGVSVERQRLIFLLISTSLAGASVAVGGGIAFLGLVAPHLARRLIGPKHQLLLPASALVGALLLLVADMLARNLLAPSEIPVGIVVSAIGAPYFLYLLMKSKS
ncbi:FecCD family ABC transporter permease [Bacillus fonticola]|uniref:FecCD family ABC transporter permease n=1 Tax=Bacillus fonticola TaxID=2728853 RepID=UPI0014731806|nr:iron ABC transporter permease [Bacillus fonticola]